MILGKGRGKEEIIDEDDLGCPVNPYNLYPYPMTSELSWNPTIHVLKDPWECDPSTSL